MRQCSIAPGFAALLLLAGCAAHRGGESDSSSASTAVQPGAARAAATPVPAQPAEPPAAADARSTPAKSGPGEASPPVAAAPGLAEVEEVMVTGSYIRGTAEDVALPIDVISVEELERHGSPSLVDLMKNLPATTAVPHTSNQRSTENYRHFNENPLHLTSEQPVSTLSIDVDTGAYANVRRYLLQGRLPPGDAVRVEEMLNYFDYQYAPPRNADVPFSVTTEIAPTPWNPATWLLKLAIQGRMISSDARPPANLVFLVDVSGSMQDQDKLPLLKQGLRLLVEQLTGRDRISMVVYAGRSGVVLEPTAGDQHARVLDAIEKLAAGGSTNGGEGIERAYQLARAAFLPDAVNRVILATDGDFNVGVVDFEALLDIAKRQRASGVALTTLGFGSGNYNDELLEQLADAGDGNYAYVDNLGEARKVLVTELSATLVTIAKDVKVQVEFNPRAVLEYRLIGYQNRLLERQDFNNDAVDAGEIGAGHRVTALYEIVPVGGKASVDPLRYATAAPRSRSRHDELAYLRLRYKQPDARRSRLLEVPIVKPNDRQPRTSVDFQFAASVAAFGELLRGGQYLGEFGYDQISALASSSLGADREGYRREFVSLVKRAQSLAAAQPPEQKVGDLHP